MKWLTCRTQALLIFVSVIVCPTAGATAIYKLFADINVTITDIQNLTTPGDLSDFGISGGNVSNYVRTDESGAATTSVNAAETTIIDNPPPGFQVGDGLSIQLDITGSADPFGAPEPGQEGSYSEAEVFLEGDIDFWCRECVDEFEVTFLTEYTLSVSATVDNAFPIEQYAFAGYYFWFGQGSGSPGGDAPLAPFATVEAGAFGPLAVDSELLAGSVFSTYPIGGDNFDYENTRLRLEGYSLPDEGGIAYAKAVPAPEPTTLTLLGLGLAGLGFARRRRLHT